MFRAGFQEESSERFMYTELANSGKWLWEGLLEGSHNCKMDESPSRAVAVGMKRRERTRSEVIVLVN